MHAARAKVILDGADAVVYWREREGHAAPHAHALAREDRTTRIEAAHRDAAGQGNGALRQLNRVHIKDKAAAGSLAVQHAGPHEALDAERGAVRQMVTLVHGKGIELDSAHATPSEGRAREQEHAAQQCAIA